jgi:hypothetical protein
MERYTLSERESESERERERERVRDSKGARGCTYVILCESITEELFLSFLFFSSLVFFFCSCSICLSS